MRVWHRLAFLVILMLCVTIGGCGSTDTGSNQGPLPKGAPPAPTSSDPWFGTAGNVLISAPGASTDGPRLFLWIGFNSPVKWQNFLNLNRNMPNSGLIGGRVVVDSSAPLGFYFDPSTTSSAEIVAETFTTSLSQISANPTQYTVYDRWYVTSTVEAIR